MKTTMEKNDSYGVWIIYAAAFATLLLADAPLPLRLVGLLVLAFSSLYVWVYRCPMRSWTLAPPVVMMVIHAGRWAL